MIAIYETGGVTFTAEERSHSLPLASDVIAVFAGQKIECDDCEIADSARVPAALDSGGVSTLLEASQGRPTATLRPRKSSMVRT